MTDRDRLEQLDVLIERLRGLPASPNRDWMIGEVRARKVDVETGVRPGPLRTREPRATPPPSEASGPAPAPRAGRLPRRPTRSRSGETARPAEHHRAESHVPPAPGPAAAAAARSEQRIDLLEIGGELSLGELPAEAPAIDGHLESRPWARGLRG